MKKVVGTIFLVIIIGLTIYLSLFNKKSEDPRVYYNVYLKSELIGTVESKDELEKYINTKGKEIKEKYGVDQIYSPKDLEVVKSISFKKKIDTVEEIYNKINEKDAFTINGYKVKISGRTEEDEDLIIYVTEKEVLSSALEQVISAFVGKDRYNAYKAKEEDPIVRQEK